METVQDVKEQARFIGIRQVCEIAGFSKSSILRKIEAREFPEPVIQDGNVTRWDYTEVMQWRAEQFKKREARNARVQAEARAEVFGGAVPR
jgi:predicted DNA-binding transcriptional regulator AlpA